MSLASPATNAGTGAAAFLRRALFALVTVLALGGTAPAAEGPAVQGAVAGSVSSSDGVPLEDATVNLRGNGIDRRARTDRAGRFTLLGVSAGTYALGAEAAGYDRLTGRTVGVQAAATTQVALGLARSPSSLVTIGHVETSGGSALSTSSAPMSSLDPQDYAARGYARMSDVLQNDASTTLVHPLGGSTVLPTSVALRGPDPTETLIDVDGHQVNSGNTGDFDLSLLDPADFGNVELVKGIAPSSLVGPSTIDGAINIRTIEPTTSAHGLFRVSGGSFNAFAETLQATGSAARLGYAFSLHRTTSSGEVNQPILDAANADVLAQVGSAVDGSTALAKLRYALGKAGEGYLEFSMHAQSVFRDLSAALSSIPSLPSVESNSLPVVNGFTGTTLQAHNAAYGFDASLPIGARDAGGIAHANALFRHYTSLVSQSVDGSGADTSPDLYNDRDLITDDTLQLDRQFSNSALSLQYEVRSERLTTNFATGVVNDQSIVRRIIGARSSFRPADDAGPTRTGSSPGVSRVQLGQTQRSAALRYSVDPTANIHLTLATYFSNYSTFGTDVGPRLGIVWTPSPRTALRFSLGTTYQAPQLPELFVPPVLPAAVGGYVSIGNPNLKPDHATEYALGLERILNGGAHRTDLSVDFYRVNLRGPSSTYRPPLDPNCGAGKQGGDGTPCPLSYPINAGDAVYRGVEVAVLRRLAAATTVRAAYAVRSAYLTSVPPDIADGSLVVGEQSQRLPLQKGTLRIATGAAHGLNYGAELVYEGRYNELAQPPFATLSGRIGYNWRSFEAGLSATNITNVYDQRFTRLGAGVPYAGLSGPLSTDSYALQGTAFAFTLTRRY